MLKPYDDDTRILIRQYDGGVMVNHLTLTDRPTTYINIGSMGTVASDTIMAGPFTKKDLLNSKRIHIKD
jgi:hypothetical protein